MFISLWNYTVQATFESWMILHRETTWNDGDPHWLSSYLRTQREVEQKAESFLIYFYLGGSGSYSKPTSSIKDRTESSVSCSLSRNYQLDCFPESTSSLWGGLLRQAQSASYTSQGCQRRKSAQGASGLDIFLMLFPCSNTFITFPVFQ